MPYINKESVAKKNVLLEKFQNWLKDNPAPVYDCFNKKSIIKNAVHIFKQQSAYASIVDGCDMKYCSLWFTLRLEEAVEKETNLNTVFRIGRELIASYFAGTFDKRTGTFYVKIKKDMTLVKKFNLRLSQLKNAIRNYELLPYLTVDRATLTISSVRPKVIDNVITWQPPIYYVFNGVDAELQNHLEDWEIKYNIDPRKINKQVKQSIK